jgi:starch synthase
MKRMTALAVASEISPLVKTGGLADVVGALPSAMAAEKIDTTTLIPGYDAVIRKVAQGEVVHEFSDLFGGPAQLCFARAEGLRLLVLIAPHLYARPGGPYTDADGADYHDNAFRFAALANVASLVGQGLLSAFAPDIIHAHDWQAGLTPAYLHYSEKPRPATIITIHNLAFQGKFPKDILTALGLPPHSFTLDGVEYYEGIGFLKAGLQFADRITTVSPSYAEEILSAGGGMGLDGLLRARADVLTGILNGVDDTIWNPAEDRLIAERYDHLNLAARINNRTALQRRLGLVEDADAFLIGAITRLTWQKGLDLLLETLPVLMKQRMQLALLGAGDRVLESAFSEAAQLYPGQIGVHIGYDEGLAHLIQSGVDALLVPSRFEPCGLTQMCALRYGAIPIVARVGGLKDTIIDANEMALAAGVATGLHFSPPSAEALAGALRRSLALFQDKRIWRRLQMNGMATDVSWRNPARHYADLYRGLVASHGAGNE